MAINKVILVGNVGKEPEIRSLSNGGEVATFSLATTDAWKDKTTHEKREKTEWHKIVIYNAGLVTITKNYVKKGSKLYIEGALQTRKWTNQSGEERYATEVVLQGFGANLQLLSSTGDRTRSDGNISAQDSGSNAFVADDVPVDDDIPF